MYFYYIAFTLKIKLEDQLLNAVVTLQWYFHLTNLKRLLKYFPIKCNIQGVQKVLHPLMNFGETKINNRPSGQVYIIKGEDFSDQKISIFAQQLRLRGGREGVDDYKIWSKNSWNEYVKHKLEFSNSTLS